MPEQRIIARATILARIEAECKRQEDKWGVQNHPDGTNAAEWRVACRRAKRHCDKATEDKKVTWRHILEEEVCEAFAEVAPEALIEELIQCAAVIVSWITAIERRRAIQERSEAVTRTNSIIDGWEIRPKEWAQYNIDDATIITREDGTAYLRAPHCTDDTFHRVRPNKEGYMPKMVDGVWCWVKP
jgi:hypothetical protein